jgi:CRP/FNR family transcriptional regulator, cyclic AMP receptor protein
MDSDSLLKVEKCCEERPVRSRQIIFLIDQKHEHVFILRSGRVKLTKSSQSGKEVIVALVSPQEVFGEAGLFSNTSTYTCSCEAMEDSVLLCFKRQDLEDIVGASPAAMAALYQIQSLRRLEAEERLANLVFYDVTSRLAHLLVNLCAKFGRDTKVGTLIRVKVTHQDLANLIGSTRETTTLILSEFRRLGLVDFAGRKIIIIDAKRLLMIEGASYLRKTTASEIGGLV